MRFQYMARRMFIAPALGLALVAAITACSSNSSSSSSSVPATTSSSAPAASSSPSGGSSAAAATIKSNWEAFFSSATPAAKRISLLQNGQAFESALEALAKSPLASAASAKVVSVQMTSPTQATVKYDIQAGGVTVLSGQTGTAVLENGTWKVADSSFCGLLALENNGKAPSVCSSAG
jgi:hypothetical protein